MYYRGDGTVNPNYDNSSYKRLEIYRKLVTETTDPFLKQSYEKEIRKAQERLAILNSQPYQHMNGQIYLKESDINKY